MVPNSKKGFTLIELLVAMTIMGILSVIGISTYMGVQARARDAQRLDDAKKIITALEQYKSGVGHYPAAVAGTGGCTGWCESDDTVPWLPGIDTSNFKNSEVPIDPKNVQTCTMTAGITTCSIDLLYKYKVSTSGNDYCLEIPQETNVSGHPYYKSLTSWKLRFGPNGPNFGICNTS